MVSDICLKGDVICKGANFDSSVAFTTASQLHCGEKGVFPQLFFSSIQMLLPLKTQEDLDQAVMTLGLSSGVNGLLRILLKTPKNNPVSAEDAKRLEDADPSCI